MGEMAGVGPTSRGVADPNLKDAPAAALAILDSKASQSTSIFEKRYRAALGKIGTDTLEIYKLHAGEPRLTALVGRKNRGRLLSKLRDGYDLWNAAHENNLLTYVHMYH